MRLNTRWKESRVRACSPSVARLRRAFPNLVETSVAPVTAVVESWFQLYIAYVAFSFNLFAVSFPEANGGFLNVAESFG